MGMDYVEIVMDLEEEFDIRLDGDAHLPAATVGELCDVVIHALEMKGEPTSGIHRHVVLARICRIIGELLAIDPASIKEHDRIVEDLGAT